MEKEQLFQQDAKNIVDMCFESKLFKDDVTRDQMTAFESYIQYIFQTRYDSHIKLLSLTERMNKAKEKLP